jgi:hypothetical protein
LKNSLVVCDESGHTEFPFSFVILSWGELGELWLICPELPLILRVIPYATAAQPQSFCQKHCTLENRGMKKVLIASVLLL